MHAPSSPSASAEVWCPHVTVATVVADGPRYLMVEEDIHGRVRYNQPAGHLEPGESLQQAALRETLEETGWDVELEHFVGVHQWYSATHGDHIVRFTFAARALKEREGHTLDDGIHRALWLDRSEIAGLGDALRSPLVLMSIDEWLAGRRLPLEVVRHVAAGAVQA
ncbi:NUDIX hydrolase [Oleiagrimonas sp. C23AA]|uniref:NUDIX hydrolase n=1 Tax=Oleiagrimonas sp. C23AA TaxID=2719047 RepID=UPI0014200BDA|nr:NUDIX hydrolase [Oleiagrimonas sp. C23AA]NII10362.1 NUDIX hydrolase [Oleiagrimonas sp. C23AA]